jgi:membrane protease YdiL (CAAX protease family)
LAIVVSAVLFAVMHFYAVVMPYAFLAGLFTGWLRIRTGSTLNTLFVHTLNNVLFLGIGLLLLK